MRARIVTEMLSRTLLTGAVAALLAVPQAFGFTAAEGIAIVLEISSLSREFLEGEGTASVQGLPDTEPAVEVEECSFSSQESYHVGETPILRAVAKVSYGRSDGKGVGKLIIFRNGKEIKRQDFSQVGRGPFARVRFDVHVLALRLGDAHFECRFEVRGYRRPYPFALREPMLVKDRGGPVTIRFKEPYELKWTLPSSQYVNHGEPVRGVLWVTVQTQATGKIVEGTCLVNGKAPRSLWIPGNAGSGGSYDMKLTDVAEVARAGCPLGFDGEETIKFRLSDIRIELLFNGVVGGSRKRVRLPYVYFKTADELVGPTAISRPRLPGCAAHEFDIAACRCRPTVVPPTVEQRGEVPDSRPWVAPREALPPIVLPLPMPRALPSIQPLPVPPLVETPGPATRSPVFELPRLVVRGQTVVIEGGPYRCGAARTVPVLARESLVVTECAGDRLVVAIPADAPLGQQEIAVQESPQVHFLVGTTTVVDLEAGRTRTPSSLQTVSLWVQLHGTADRVAMKIASSDPGRCRFPGNRSIQVETSGGEPNVVRFECQGGPSTASIRLNIQLGEEAIDLPTADPADNGG